MPADTELRSEMLELLVSYMKGHINSSAFDHHLGQLRERCWKRDHSAAMVAYMLYNFYDDFTDHPVSTTEQGWNLLRRYGAFLRTESELEARKKWLPHRKQLIASSCLIGLLIGLMASLSTGSWWYLIVTWLIVGVINALTHAEPAFDPRTQEVLKYAPFWTEAEWKEHEHLIESADLPIYDPATHGKPWVSGMPASQLWSSRLVTIVFAPAGLLWRLRRMKHEVFMVCRHCRYCGYDLTGNVSGVCPECGQQINGPAGSAA